MSMINGTRLYDHLTRLGRIGFVPKEGTTRLPYTPAYDEGRIYVQQCMEQAGLQTSVDPVGNLIGTLPGQGEIICIGSHIDTVPGGGIYDGTYGVLSGIECVQRLKAMSLAELLEVRHLPAERLMKLCGQIWPSTDLQWSRSAPAEEI